MDSHDEWKILEFAPEREPSDDSSHRSRLLPRVWRPGIRAHPDPVAGAGLDVGSVAGRSGVYRRSAGNPLRRLRVERAVDCPRSRDPEMAAARRAVDPVRGGWRASHPPRARDQRSRHVASGAPAAAAAPARQLSGRRYDPAAVRRRFVRSRRSLGYARTRAGPRAGPPGMPSCARASRARWRSPCRRCSAV